MNLRRAGRAALIGLAALALAALATAIAGSAMGLFSGTRPADLGLRDGKLRGGDWRPNWVSSQVAPSDEGHFILPLACMGDAVAAWAALERAILEQPRATLVTRSPGYLHAEFASKAMGFVDDAEFALDARAGVIHVRSGARLGVRDFGVNRKRVESLRKIMMRARR